MRSDPPLRMGKKKLLLCLVGAILLVTAAFAWSGAFRSEKRAETDHATAVVARGPLTISVIVSGTIKAKEQIVIKNEVEGRTSIIYLVPEGTRVRKGDLLVELDVSKLLDERVEQQIRVQNAEAAFVSARENLAVVENQAQADVEKAQLVYDFAREDLKKYSEGEHPSRLKELESRITLAREELTRAEEKATWSRRLHHEKYISESELAADELNLKTKTLELDLAESNLDLFSHYTHKRESAQLQSDVSQARMALERTERKAKAEVVMARAALEARKAELDQQKDKLARTESQIEKATIYAPSDGLVIHATSAQSGGPGRRMAPPLEEGQEVRERQELIHLPTSAAAKVEVAIPEASLDKVRPGLPVKVTVDAIPGKTFTGKVVKIALLPDAQSAWLNPDLKVYNTEIHLGNRIDALRAGMSCKAEIIVEQHVEATYVPVQAVLRVSGQPTVYVVREEGRLEPREVDIGLDNNRVMRITRGLEPGDLVSLTPPLAAAEIGPEQHSQDPDIGSIPSAEEAEAVSRTPSPDEEDRRRDFLESLSPEEKEAFTVMSPEEKWRFVRQKTGDVR
jgi:HlyD family secretion protein